jgi:hypothetical protein
MLQRVPLVIQAVKIVNNQAVYTVKSQPLQAIFIGSYNAFRTVIEAQGER